jgi:hypothetical protein
MSMNFPTIMDQNNLSSYTAENHIYTAETQTKTNKTNNILIVKHSIIFTVSLTVPTCINTSKAYVLQTIKQSNFLSSNVSNHHHSLSHCPCIYLSLLQATYYSQGLLRF